MYDRGDLDYSRPWRFDVAVYGTVILGDNEIQNCDAALVVEGEEVFRLRERQHDGQLVVDFDLRDEGENRLAKIAKNHVVYCAPGLVPRSLPGKYEVLREETGEVLAAVEEVSPGTVRLTGTFCVRGWKVEASTSGVRIGGLFLSGNKIVGCGNAIVLGRAKAGIGA